MDKLKANLLSALQEAAAETTPAPAEDYETIRKRTREEEIRRLLDQLQD